MRIRSVEYLQWISQGIPQAEHDQILPGGVQLNVEARMKPHGFCAIFVSIYSRSGQALYEELFATLHATPEEGVTWGIGRGLAKHHPTHSQHATRQTRPPYKG